MSKKPPPPPPDPHWPFPPPGFVPTYVRDTKPVKRYPDDADPSPI